MFAQTCRAPEQDSNISEMVCSSFLTETDPDKLSRASIKRPSRDERYLPQACNKMSATVHLMLTRAVSEETSQEVKLKYKVKDVSGTARGECGMA